MNFNLDLKEYYFKIAFKVIINFIYGFAIKISM